jgi:hypothetical protein
MDETALLPFKARAQPLGHLFASTPMTKSQTSASLDAGLPLFHLSDACQPTPQERAFWSRDLMVSIYHSCSTIPHAVQWLQSYPSALRFSHFDAEQVMEERGGLADEAAFANDQDEVTHMDAA